MELEDREQIERHLKCILSWESRIIDAKNDYKSRKSTCENEIKRHYGSIFHVKRKALLKQQGLEWSCPADDLLCDEEGEKELQRWKNLTAREKIKERFKRISLQEETEDDWEPMTDIQVDRWIEEELEKQ